MSSEFISVARLHPIHPEWYSDATLHLEYGLNVQLRPLRVEWYPGPNLHSEYDAHTQLHLVNQELSAAPRLHQLLVSSMLVVNSRSAASHWPKLDKPQPFNFIFLLNNNLFRELLD